MAEKTAASFDRADFDSHIAKFALAALPIFFTVLTLPERYSEPLAYRLLIFAGFLLAAFLIYSNGRRAKAAGNASLAAARTITSLVTLLAGLWMVAPSTIMGSAAASDARSIVRSSIGLRVEPDTLADRIKWRIKASDPAFSYVADDLAGSIREKSQQVIVGKSARRASGAIEVDVRHASAASGEYRVEARGAILAKGAAQCQFTVSTARPAALRSIDDQLSDQILEKVQSYVRGNDQC